MKEFSCYNFTPTKKYDVLKFKKTFQKAIPCFKINCIPILRISTNVYFKFKTYSIMSHKLLHSCNVTTN